MQKQISFSWWQGNDIHKEISYLHQSELLRAAGNKIAEMINEGYVEGQLLHEIDDIQFAGYWAIYQN